VPHVVGVIDKNCNTEKTPEHAFSHVFGLVWNALVQLETHDVDWASHSENECVHLGVVVDLDGVLVVEGVHVVVVEEVDRHVFGLTDAVQTGQPVVEPVELQLLFDPAHFVYLGVQHGRYLQLAHGRTHLQLVVGKVQYPRTGLEVVFSLERN